MADASVSHGQTDAVAANHISEQMFTNAATRLNGFDGDSAEFSDGQAGWTRPMGHSFASHAIVVMARARALRLRQAPALRR